MIRTPALGLLNQNLWQLESGLYFSYLLPRLHIRIIRGVLENSNIPGPCRIDSEPLEEQLVKAPSVTRLSPDHS